MRDDFLCCRWFALGLGSLLVVSGMAIVTSPADAKRRTACMADHFHYGSSSGLANKRTARREAIASWQGFTAFEYGNAWASFKRSRSKGIRCREDETGWGCKVEAVPCR